MQDIHSLSRRDFLKHAGTASTLALLWEQGAFPCLAAEGFSPPLAVFSKLYQEIKLTFAQSAQVTSEAGLDGIDCAVRPGGEILPENAAEEMPRYAAELEKRKVRMLLLTTGITGISSPHAESILRTASKLGIKYYRLGYWSHRNGEPPETLQQKIRAELKQLAALNRQLGVCGVFQNHSAPKNKSSGHAGGDLDELYSIVKDFDPEEIGVAFDFGHAIITHGDGWTAHFDKLKPHIKIAYIKDVSRSSGFVPFGTGEFADAGIFRRLKQMDYRAPLSIHIEFDWAGKGRAGTAQTLVKTLRESRLAVEKWIKHA